MPVILAAAPRDYLAALRRRVAEAGLVAAVARRDTPAIYDWVAPQVGMQGISDRAARVFAARRGVLTWNGVDGALASRPSCPRLRGWWAFRCGYRKGSQACAEPDHRAGCPLPQHPMRKGSLNEAAFGLHLFARDACGGDVVGWLDRRLADADHGSDPVACAERMSDAVVLPLTEVPGVGRKLAGMMLAELLLGADSARPRWIAAGAAAVVIDSLVHNVLHRTGLLRRHGAGHPYGPRCWTEDGCAGVIRVLARDIDVRRYDPALPAYAPRFICWALWSYAAGDVTNLCNGRRIDDRRRCQQWVCPAYRCCDRVVLYGST